MKLSIYTPERALFDKKPVKEILVPSVKGELGILPGHASLISLLQAGVLKYKTTESSSWEKVAIGWGYLEIFKEEIKILAESVQTKEALDLAQIKKELKEINKKLEVLDLEPSEREQLKRKKLQLEGERDL